MRSAEITLPTNYRLNLKGVVILTAVLAFGVAMEIPMQVNAYNENNSIIDVNIVPLEGLVRDSIALNKLQTEINQGYELKKSDKFDVQPSH